MTTLNDRLMARAGQCPMLLKYKRLAGALVKISNEALILEDTLAHRNNT